MGAAAAAAGVNTETADSPRTSSLSLLEVLLEVLASSTDQTSPSSSNETALPSTGSVSPGSSGMSNVLMVTTTMRMLDRVHGNTTDSGPILPLRLSLVVGSVGFKEGLVASGTTGDNTDHGSAASENGL